MADAQPARRSGDGHIWAAIEDLRLGQAVREEKMDGFVEYQRERNTELLAAVKDTNLELSKMRAEAAKHNQKEDMLNASFFKKGVWFLGAVIVALSGYIWEHKN